MCEGFFFFLHSLCLFLKPSQCNSCFQSPVPNVAPHVRAYIWIWIFFPSSTESDYTSYPSIVWAGFPSPCGVGMAAPEGSFALIGEGRAKSSSDRTREERTGKAKQAAPEKRPTFSPFHVVSSRLPLNRQSSIRKKVKKVPKGHWERCSQRRDGFCWFFS